jgi:hypothetical protein
MNLVVFNLIGTPEGEAFGKTSQNCGKPQAARRRKAGFVTTRKTGSQAWIDKDHPAPPIAAWGENIAEVVYFPKTRKP